MSVWTDERRATSKPYSTMRGLKRFTLSLATLVLPVAAMAQAERSMTLQERVDDFVASVERDNPSGIRRRADGSVWFVAPTLEDGTRIHFNVDDMIRSWLSESDLKLVWVWAEYQRNGHPILSNIRAYYRVSCSQRSIATLTTVYYRKDGSNQTDTTQSGTRYIVPGSFLSTLHTVVCDES